MGAFLAPQGMGADGLERPARMCLFSATVTSGPGHRGLSQKATVFLRKEGWGGQGSLGPGMEFRAKVPRCRATAPKSVILPFPEGTLGPG